MYLYVFDLLYTPMVIDCSLTTCCISTLGWRKILSQWRQYMVKTWSTIGLCSYVTTILLLLPLIPLPLILLQLQLPLLKHMMLLL